MRTAIIYISSHGTTESVAEKIKTGIGADKADIYNLKKDKNIALDKYDQIILGGSIHAGQVQRRVKKFIALHHDELLARPLGLFLCCMDQDKAQQQFERAFPESLRNHAKSKKLCGGEFRIEKMNGLERFITKKVAKVTESISKIRETEIEALVNEMKQ